MKLWTLTSSNRHTPLNTTVYMYELDRCILEHEKCHQLGARDPCALP